MNRLALFVALVGPAACCFAQPFAPPPAPPVSSSSSSAEAALEPMDECQVIARVDGQVVLACEVIWQVNLRLEGQLDRIPPGQEDEIRKMLMQQYLMSMLDMKMLYADFRRKAPQADLAAIQKSLNDSFEEDELPQLMKRVDVQDEAELSDRLLALGTSVRAQRDDFYQRMIAQSWIRESVDVRREVTHEEMLTYYDEHATEYDYPTQAKWEELMVRFDKYPTKSKAYQALAKIGNDAYQAAVAQPDRTQAAFAAIAKAKSQGFNASSGGLYDWTTQGALAAERVDEAIFTLPIGEMSPILEGNRGFHIVRVLERKQAGRTPFTEVQTEIRDKIRDERFQVAINKKLDELRRNTRIWTLYTGDVDSAEYAAARSSKNKRR